MDESQAGRVGTLRRRNTGLVLGVLRSGGPTTRTVLARTTGLAKATIGSIVADLEAAGLVAETGELTSGRGRPGRSLALTGTDVVGLGLEVNVDYVSTVTLDVGGVVQHSETVPVGEADPLDVLLEVAAARAAAVAAQGHRLTGATVAVPGLVDADRSVVRWAPNLDWSDLALADEVHAVAGIGQCAVDNDANCAALAEVAHGAAADVQHLLYLTGTVGIGGGWIVDGTLQRGGDGFAGEIGHLPLGEPTAPCGCGRLGCWEATVGVRGMLTRTGLTDLGGDPMAVAAAVAERAATDPQVADALAETGRWLGRGLAAVSGVVDPDTVVLGGYFVPLAEWILPAAQVALAQHLSFADLARPSVRLSTLGLHAAAVGAAEDALAGVLAGGRVG